MAWDLVSCQHETTKLIANTYSQYASSSHTYLCTYIYHSCRALDGILWLACKFADTDLTIMPPRKPPFDKLVNVQYICRHDIDLNQVYECYYRSWSWYIRSWSWYIHAYVYTPPPESKNIVNGIHGKSIWQHRTWLPFAVYILPSLYYTVLLTHSYARDLGSELTYISKNLSPEILWNLVLIRGYSIVSHFAFSSSSTAYSLNLLLKFFFSVSGSAPRRFRVICRNLTI